MYKIPLSEIKDKIVASEKITADKLEEKIKLKINELSGLISEEGAAHIIANELGIPLVETKENVRLKIKEIYSGMKNISTLGKVTRKFDIREFSKGENTGKVGSLIIGDDTGTIRVVFWNDQTDTLAKINEDDVILVKEAYVRENNNNKEIHLGERGEIEINPEGEVIDKVRQTSSYGRKTIGALNSGEDGVELLGTIVQVFDPRFFQVCPECNRRVQEVEGKFECATHHEVVPSLSYVLNLVIDDGTGTIRSVFWKNQTNHLLNKEEQEISEFKDDLTKFEDLKTDLLGEQFKLMGKVVKNDLFDRLEFSVQLVEKADPQEEVKNLEN